MPMNPKIIKAVDLLASFDVGDPVRVTFDGRVHDMVVSRAIHRSDGQFGSYESSRITVTFGPGRYATEVTAEQLAAGSQTLEKLEKEGGR